ncbi:MAG: T9SS type A sorting domain-containing protein [Saprospiraceae bacterium]
MDLHTDGKILIGGASYDVTTTTNMAVLRLKSNGTVDSSFALNGIFQLDLVPGYNESITQIKFKTDSSGSIDLGSYYDGSTNVYHNFLLSLNNDGTPNITFGNNGIVLLKMFTTAYGQKAEALALGRDDKIYVAGDVTPNPNTTDPDIGVVALSSDSVVDTSFGTTGLVSIEKIYGQDPTAMEVVFDGKILVGGDSYTGSIGRTDLMLFRLTEHGVVDSTFGTNGIVIMNVGNHNDRLRDFCVDEENGNIIICGTYQPSADPTNYDNYIARLLPNGEADPAFATGGKFKFTYNSNEEMRAIAIQADHRPVSVGFKTNATQNIDMVVVRLTEDGAFDLSWNGTGTVVTNIGLQEYPNEIAIQPDGKVLVAGSYVESFNNFVANTFALRYDTDLPTEVPDIFLHSDHGLRIFPNPASSFAWMQIEDQGILPEKLDVYDISGKWLQSFDLTSTRQLLDLQELASGTYLIRGATSDKIFITKLLVNN